jgi:hypothetical protein
LQTKLIKELLIKASNIAAAGVGIGILPVVRIAGLSKKIKISSNNSFARFYGIAGNDIDYFGTADVLHMFCSPLAALSGDNEVFNLSGTSLGTSLPAAKTNMRIPVISGGIELIEDNKIPKTGIKVDMTEMTEVINSIYPHIRDDHHALGGFLLAKHQGKFVIFGSDGQIAGIANITIASCDGDDFSTFIPTAAPKLLCKLFDKEVIVSYDNEFLTFSNEYSKMQVRTK